MVLVKYVEDGNNPEKGQCVGNEQVSLFCPG